MNTKMPIEEVLKLELPSGLTIEQDWQARWEVVERWHNNWRTAARGFRFSIDAADCAFCSLYFLRGCLHCPVCEETGLGACRGTPYDKVANILMSREWRVFYWGEPTNIKDRLLSATEKEYQLLVSLALKEFPIKGEIL